MFAKVLFLVLTNNMYAIRLSTQVKSSSLYYNECQSHQCDKEEG